MKENKKIFLITLVLNIFIILLLIFCKTKLIYDLGLAILGGSIVSNIMCFTNYIILRNKTIEEIVFDIYKYNNETYAKLFEIKDQMSIGGLNAVVSTASCYLVDIKYKINGLIEGMFKFEKNKAGIAKRILNHIEQTYENKYQQIEMYLYFNEDEAKDNFKIIYKMIDEILDDNKPYRDSYELAKMVGLKVSSIEKLGEECKQEIQKTYANSCKKEIQNRKEK